MNHKYTRLLCVCAGLLLTAVSACKKESEDQYANDLTKGYFPLKIGKAVTYQVDSIIWNDFNCTQRTSRYQMRYTIMDTFSDNQHRRSYRIETSIRTQDSLPWSPGTVLYVTPTTTGLEYVQSNLRFIKLSFPITEGRTWKGNSMIFTNDQDYQYFADWNYKYVDVSHDYNADSIAYNNTVTVLEADEQQNDPTTMPTAYAYKTFSKEVYAYDIGMVYRELTHWIYDPGVRTCRKGYSVKMRAIDHN